MAGLIDFKLGDVGNIFTSLREAWTGEKIVDPVQLAKIDLQLSELEQMANQGQISINRVEAAHKNIFVAGWRPFIGWVCGIAIMYAFVLQPLLEWATAIFHFTVEVKTMVEGKEVIENVLISAPKLQVDTLYQLVLAMLGMAGLRTYEKYNSVAREK